MTVPSHLVTALADRYRIERELGSGGMATVYLAHDVRHDRKVAVKVLRPELAAAIGPDRFLAEIKTTAHLQHPHILGLIDSGEAGGTVFYVMPFVQGESLRERLKRELQLPVADGVRIATQVASALDYAHRHGVIHRDIKPENILLHDQQALVADFGIALAVSRSSDGRRVTEAGTSLGTPQYMSPEQAMAERTLDARTDVYSLGCVLYEMLTGEPPFAGPNAQAVIAKLMTVEPEPVTTLRKSVPTNVAAATMMALQKVPADRFATPAELASALADPRFVAPAVAAQRAARRGPAMSGREMTGAVAIALLAIAAVTGWLRGGKATTSSVVERFEIPVPDSVFSNQVALSRDGRRILWSSPTGFWERSLDSLTIRRVREPASSSPGAVREVAPDGRDVLVSGRGSLGIVSLSGGAARSLVTQPGRGSAWGADGFVYFGYGVGPPGPARGIARVPVAGGAVDTIARITDSSSVADIVALPGGRGLVAALSHNGVDSVFAFDLRTKKWKALAAGGPQVRFVEEGYLLFATGQSVSAAPFDADRLTLTKPPLPFLELTGGGITLLATAANVLVYSPQPEFGGSGVVVRSRNGTARTLPNMPDSLRFSSFTVSPDGRRFAAVGTALSAQGGGRGGPQTSVPNVWVYQFPDGPMTRLRSDERDQSPAWMPPAGRELSFVRVSTDTPATSTLMRRNWDGSTEPVAILERPGGAGRGASLGPVAWHPDGRRAVIRVAGGGPVTTTSPAAPAQGGRGGAGGRGGPPGDLIMLSLDARTRFDTVVATTFAESEPAISPDGRLLAYTSDQSGQTEVYIRPLAGVALRQVSLKGGTRPKWSHSGRELFYVIADTLIAAEFRGGPDLEIGEVRPVFRARNLSQGYGVLPGDTSFVTLPVPPTNLLVVVVNFVRELDRLFAGTRSP